MIDESRHQKDGTARAAVDVPSLFPLLFDQLADNVCVTDSDGTILYVNDAFERTTGYDRAEVIGRSMSILKSGAHPREVYDDLWRTIRAGTPFRFLFTNRKKNGDLYEEGLMVSPLRGLDGDTTYYLAMGRVINAFRQTYEAFTVLANASPASIYLESKGRLFFVNEFLAAFLGLQPGDMIGREWLEFVVEDDRETVLREVDATLTGHQDGPFEYRVVTREGAIRWVMASVARAAFRGNQAVEGDFVSGYILDITDRKLAEERLRYALSLHTATIESTTDGIVVINAARELESHNRRFTELWNLGDVLLVGADRTRVAILEKMKDPDQFMAAVTRTWDSPWVEETGTSELKDGRVLEYFSKPQIVDGAVVGRVWSWRDVTERHRFEDTLLRLANRDSITGLLSRRKLQEEMAHSLSTNAQSPAALLLLDLDRFKEVNDTFGHQAGDEVLVQVGSTLGGAGCGEIIGRYGGDEFAIFLPGHAKEAALATAQRLRRTMDRRGYAVAGADVTLSSSIGIAVYPADGASTDELLSAADLALYEAKGDGRGRVRLYSPRLRERSRLGIRSEGQALLREATSRRDGKLYAQEIVALRPNLPSIYKLSIRPAGARGRIVPVNDVRRLAEQAGLTNALARWLIDEALVFGQQLSAIDAQEGMAIDLNGASLANSDVIRGLLALSKLRAGEGPLIVGLADVKSLPGVRPAIRRLHKAGYHFKVAKGSPQRLQEVVQHLPLSYIEIEDAIASQVAKQAGARALARGIVLLADSIGARTLASGVRDAATLSALRDLGADYAQGSYVGRARPAAAFLTARVASVAA